MTTLRLCVSAALIGYLLTIVPLGELRAPLAAASTLLLLLATSLKIFEPVLSGLRTYGVGRAIGLALTRWQVIEAVFIANFYALFLPGQLAGIATVLRYRQLGSPVEGAVAALVVSRLVEVTSFLVVGTLCALVDVDRFPLATGLAVVVPLSTLLLAALGLFAFARILRRPWGSPVRPIHGAVSRWLWHGRERATRLARSLACITPRAIGGPFLLALAMAGMTTFTSWLFARSLGLPVGLATAAWVIVIAYVAALVPVTYLGVGVREGIFVWLLVPLGYGAGEALMWALLLTGSRLVISALGGLAELRRRHWSSDAPRQPAGGPP